LKYDNIKEVLDKNKKKGMFNPPLTNNDRYAVK
jgi:hypothetical protein